MMGNFALFLSPIGVILLLDILSAAPRTAELDDRIINGENVPISSRPFQLYIRTYWTSTASACGASLIDANWVLTAKHCLVKGGETVQKVEIRAGSSSRNSGYQSRMADRGGVKLHPSSSPYVDLAMIYIEHPFELSQNIQIVPLNDHIADLTGKIATISGWGITETQYWPQMLSATKTKIEEDNDGRAIVMPNTNGSGACMGDSGGPATIEEDGRAIQVGVSWYVTYPSGIKNDKGICGPEANGGFGIYRDHDTVYVDIYSYMDWIRGTMGETPTGPPDTTPSDGPCVDSDNGHEDTYGDGCSWYDDNPSHCGRYDDNDFTANEMCCACKEDTGNCVDTDNGASDVEGYICNEYEAVDECGQYDDSDFNSNTMCCICGGGQKA